MLTLATIRTWPGATVAALLLYSIAVTLPHEPVQNWLLVNVVRPMGAPAYYLTMAILGFAGLGLAGLIVYRRLTLHPARRVLGAYSVLTAVLVLVAWRLLSVNNSELVHFPQYAISGLVLMALTLSVTETLSWVLLLAGVDEAHQYAVLHPTWGIPYDFNDVVLDLIGGAIGVLLCVLWLKVTPRKVWRWRPGPGFILLAVLVSSVSALLLIGRVVLYSPSAAPGYWFALSRMTPKGFWFFDPTWGPRSIHSLTPVEGPVLLLGLLYVYSWLDRRYEFKSQP